ncbi:hypothetical protein M0805_008744 [Coniferiporia weirii]|nr:hypothetical protein M0805_008744 [Coniferiporia weirii]
MVALSLIPSVPNSVAPVSGNNYNIRNLEYTHYMDNARSSTTDGNPILGYNPNIPSTDNQLWTYLTYPSSNGEVIFTLQSVSTTKNEAGFGGRGGYIRADISTNKLVQGGSPMAWKLITIIPNVYKIVPSYIPGNDSMVITDTNLASQQLELQNGTSALAQLWAFNLII